jgi:Skp family chaperone for outer membrane proteins
VQNADVFPFADRWFMDLNCLVDVTTTQTNFVRSATQRSASAVKKVIVSVSVIALLAGVLALTGDAWSQQGKKEEAAAAATNIPHKVGLIDMAYVFKNYKKFETLREDLKVEIAQSEETAKEMQKEIVEFQQKLKDLKEGGAEYTKLEQQAVKKAAEFENFRRQMSREFLKKESQIYLMVYNEVSRMVEKYATHFNYTLIIRFNREDLDTENPQALLQGMNRQVVYYRPNEDITTPVLESLNKRLDPTPKQNKNISADKSTPKN